jgi:predicted DsbA family dithiol-disulfide isomerase
MKWVDILEKGDRVDLSIEWKVLSLEQINQNRGQDFKVWEHPEYPTRGISALVAAKSALRQGGSSFKTFHRLLFKAYHDHGKDISKRSVLSETALEAGLNIDTFEEDLDLRETIQGIEDDFKEAKQSYNLFGVPSFVFENDEAIYVKIDSVPKTEEESIKMLEHLFQMGLNMPYLLELKRP